MGEVRLDHLLEKLAAYRHGEPLVDDREALVYSESVQGFDFGPTRSDKLTSLDYKVSITRLTIEASHPLPPDSI